MYNVDEKQKPFLYVIQAVFYMTWGLKVIVLKYIKQKIMQQKQRQENDDYDDDDDDGIDVHTKISLRTFCMPEKFGKFLS